MTIPLEQIYKGCPIGLCVLDRELRYEHISDRLAEMNGLPAKDHIGKYIGDILPDVAAGVVPQLEQVLRTGRPIEGGAVTAETPANPGIRRTFRHSYYPIFKDDEVVGVNCAVTEITRRGVRTDIDGSPSGIAFYDREKRCQFANNSYARMLGLTISQIKGHTLEEMIDLIENGQKLHHKSLAVANENIEKVLNGTAMTFRNTLPAVGGIRLGTKISYVPGHAGGYHVFIEDPRERQEMLREIRAGLTTPQEEILVMLAGGYPMKTIASLLDYKNISTVAYHKKRVMSRYELKTKKDIVQFAIQIGLLEP